MGISHVPSDPFEDRAAFLRAYDGFMRSTRSAPDSAYLSAGGIAHLRQQYSRTTKESLKRAIRHRLDDIRGEGGTHAHRGTVFEDEMTDINAFASTVQTMSGSDVPSVVYLWKGKLRKDKLGSSLGTSTGTMRRSGADDSAPNILVTDSEDETGLGGKLLRGVTRGKRRIGGGVTG